VGFNGTALTTPSCAAESSLSVCSAEPCVVTGIGAGTRGSWAVAADDEYVFFERNPTTLSKVPVRGGPAIDVRTDLERLWMVALDEEYVYTTEYEAGVRRVKKSGGPSELVVRPSRGHPLAIAVDREHVYVTLTDEDQILMAPKAGGEATLLAGQSAPPAIAVDDRHVYWVNEGATGSSGELVRAPLGDLTAAEVLLTALDSPRALAVGSEAVFFGSPSAAFSLPKAGGDAALVTEFEDLKSMAAYDDTVYLAGLEGLGRARLGAAPQVVDARGVLGVAVSCQGVFGTGWFESFLVRYGR
jgi:hypothetical protein